MTADRESDKRLLGDVDLAQYGLLQRLAVLAIERENPNVAATFLAIINDLRDDRLARIEQHDADVARIERLERLLRQAVSSGFAGEIDPDVQDPIRAEIGGA